MKKRSKQIISAVLAAFMAFGLTACGGEENNNSASSAEAKKYVYRMEDITTDTIPSEANVNSVTYADGRIYVFTTQYRYDEMNGMTANLISVKEDGSDKQTVELFNTLVKNPNYVPEGENEDGGADIMPLEATPRDEAEDVEGTEGTEETEGTGDTEGTADTGAEGVHIQNDSWINSNVMNESGVYIVMQKSSYSCDSNGMYLEDLGTTLELYAYDFDGKERYNVVLNDDPEKYMYINYMAADAAGNLALVSEESIMLYDASGNPLSTVETDSQNGYINGCYMGNDGKLNLIVYNNDWTEMTLRAYNLQTKAFEQDIPLPDILTNYGIRGGSEKYAILLTNSMGVYGYNIGDTEVTQILSYINSDLDGSNVNNMLIIDDTKMLMTYNDEETWSVHLAMLTYVDPADIPDKQIITLACNYLNYNIRRRVVSFNKENELYRIMVKDYATYNTPEDYSAGVTQLNNDILAGNVPDILVLDDNMPVDSYIAKGVLADIGELIDKDEELNRDDYMTNVFDAYSLNGKLYSIIPSFFVSTVIGKTADVGETPGWTMEDLKALMAKYPEASAFGETMTRSDMLWNVMMYSGSRFVDRNTGKCSFDTKEFQDMLTFIAQFPEEYDWENQENDYWRDYETQYRTGKTLLMSTSISDFYNYSYISQGYFGEPVTYIGFPTEEGTGAVIRANEQYAISAKSKFKEGAWEFLRYYLLPEYQKSNELYSLPVLKEALLDKLELAKERPYWEDENGNKEYYDNYFYFQDEQVLINPLTDEEADKLFEYISSVNMAYYYDNSLNNIITEEAASFFAGQKSVEDVTKIIQSRAELYLNESR